MASDVYRIRGGHLFITTPGEAEYLYNNVVEVEPGRFVSGHKTLLLTARTADPGRKLLVLHVHELDIRVTRFFCRSRRLIKIGRALGARPPAGRDRCAPAQVARLLSD